MFELDMCDIVKNMNTVRCFTLKRAKIIGQCIFDMVEACEKAQNKYQVISTIYDKDGNLVIPKTKDVE